MPWYPLRQVLQRLEASARYHVPVGRACYAMEPGWAVSSTRGARPSSTDVDPPGRRFADPGGHLVAELNRHTLHLEGMLRELLALLGEGLLLFGAHLGTRRAHAAGRYGVGSVPGPR